ncbi:MAG: hypothetical protein IPL47_14460 [Phyllobacteriaceae bacterium]|nr:hypothetical protein [Phyllobacteriaceae bacterium]
MIQFAFALIALAAGLAAGGMAASIAQEITGRPPGFAPPFVRPGHIIASLAVTALIGPYMLFNEALAAWREERIGPVIVATSGAIALGWALACGIVLVFLAGRLVAPF